MLFWVHYEFCAFTPFTAVYSSMHCCHLSQNVIILTYVITKLHRNILCKSLAILIRCFTTEFFSSMLAVCVAVVVSLITNHPAAASVTNSDVQKLGSSSTQFGLNLYNELRKDSSVNNLFISPTSISIALSMVLLGAKGKILFIGDFNAYHLGPDLYSITV